MHFYISIDNLRCSLEAINKNNFEHIELAKEGRKEAFQK